MGRLGNQMFQFAPSIGIANERGFSVGISIENCTRKIGTGPIDPKTGLQTNFKEKINICDNVTIRMNAAVVKDINVPGTYVGVPAKKYGYEIKT